MVYLNNVVESGKVIIFNNLEERNFQGVGELKKNVLVPRKSNGVGTCLENWPGISVRRKRISSDAGKKKKIFLIRVGDICTNRNTFQPEAELIFLKPRFHVLHLI